MKLEISKPANLHTVKYDAPDRSSDIIEVSQPFDFRALLQLAMERWRTILLASVLAATVAGYFTLKIPVKYQAKAVLQVDQEEQRLVGIDAISHEDLRATEVLNTIVQNIKNSSVLRRVVQTNKLAADPKFLSGKTDITLPEVKLVRALSGMATVKLRPETRLIDVIVLHGDPEMAEQLANAIAKEFIRQNLDESFSTATAANGLLFDEASRLKAKLESSEKEIQAYKELTQTVSLEDGQNITLQKLRDLMQKHTEAQSARLRLEADLNQVKKARNAASIFALPIVQADPAVAELQKRLLEQQIQVATLAGQYQQTHPKVTIAEQQIKELERKLQSFAQKVPALLQVSYEAALEREASLDRAVKQAQGEALALDKTGIRYNVLLREVQSDRALYDAVLKRLKETDLSRGLRRASVTLVEPASQPVSQIKPPSTLIIGGAWALAALSTLGLLYFIRKTDGSIQTVDDAEHFLGLPVWAAIPIAKKIRGSAVPHVTAEQPGSICSESFRMLRTTAAMDAAPNEKRILLFTSADPAEGKTFCSINHAICQAQENKRTLLIDLDLRKPSLGPNFSLPDGAPGVTDYLLHKRCLSDLVHSTDYPNLFVMPGGAQIANPSEELAGNSLKRLLAEASGRFDRVIIDTAPLNAVSDTFLILPFTNQVCLVVKSGKTSRKAVRRAMNLMTRTRVEPSGVVLNYLPQSTGYGYYYYYAPKYDYGAYRNGHTPKALLNP